MQHYFFILPEGFESDPGLMVVNIYKVLGPLLGKFILGAHIYYFINLLSTPMLVRQGEDGCNVHSYLNKYILCVIFQLNNLYLYGKLFCFHLGYGQQWTLACLIEIMCSSRGLKILSLVCGPFFPKAPLP